MENRNEYASLSDKLDFFSIIRDIFRSLWAILLLSLSVAMIVNVAARANYQSSYSSQAVFAVKARSGTNYSRANLTSASTMANSFSNILNSNLLKKKVCDDLNISSFNARTSAQVIKDTNLITLKVTAETPKETYNTICSVMRVINELTPYVSGNMVVEVLQEPRVPVGADAGYNGYQPARRAFIITFILGILLFGILSYFKNTIKSGPDLERKTDSRFLGQIYHEKNYYSLKDRITRSKDKHLITGIHASFDFVEGYKKIAANLSGHLKRNEEKVVMVTSVRAHEGKSTMAANLALALEESGHTVLLIDGDLRRPSLNKIFLGKNEKLPATFNDLLAGKNTVKDTVWHEKGHKLYLFLNEKGRNDSSDIVASKRMKDVVDAAKRHFDYVIIDTPPLALLSDAETLADLSDLSILTVKYDYTLAPQVNDAIDSLSGCKAEFYGCVLNDVHAMPGARNAVGGSGHYGHYGNYSHYGHYGNYGRYGKYGHYGRYGYGSYGSESEGTVTK